MALDFPLAARVLRATAVASGAILVPAGITGLIEMPTPLQIIVSVYLMLFGVVVCLVEFRIEMIVGWFRFLSTFPGRCAFFTFCGTLACALRGKWQWFAIATGIWLFLNALANLMCGVFFRSSDTSPYVDVDSSSATTGVAGTQSIGDYPSATYPPMGSSSAV